jgi:hypothetical protein
MASTPTGRGYWLVRKNGLVYNFGDAKNLGSAPTLESDPVVAIISNPVAQGYLIIRRDSEAASAGAAPKGY